MKTTALPVSRQPFASLSGLVTRIPHFIALTKPRVMALAVFTAAVGQFIAPGHLDPLLGAVSLICIAAGAGAAGVLNMRYDADIDALMTRTSGRPIPEGEVSRSEAPGFGQALACCSVPVLAMALNVVAAALHFWALSLIRIGDYARAGVPMLPVVSGQQRTALNILCYSTFLVLTSVLPVILGFASAIYGATAIVGGTVFIALAAQLSRSRGTDRTAAHRLFVFSIAYLFLLFAALLTGRPIDRWSTTVGACGARIDFGPVRVEPLTLPAGTIRGSTRFTVVEG